MSPESYQCKEDTSRPRDRRVAWSIAILVLSKPPRRRHSPTLPRGTVRSPSSIPPQTRWSLPLPWELVPPESPYTPPGLSPMIPVSFTGGRSEVGVYDRLQPILDVFLNHVYRIRLKQSNITGDKAVATPTTNL